MYVMVERKSTLREAAKQIAASVDCEVQSTHATCATGMTGKVESEHVPLLEDGINSVQLR